MPSRKVLDTDLTAKHGSGLSSPIGIADGGTGQTAQTAAFDALSPLTTAGDIMYMDATPDNQRLAKGSDGEILTLASGIPSWAAAAASGHTETCRITHASNQTISTATDTALAFDTEDFDTDTMHDTSTNNTRITFTTAGKYLIIGNMLWTSVGSGNRGIAKFRLGGSTEIGLAQQHASSNDGLAVFLAIIYDFSAAEYIELVVRQESGSDQVIQKNGEKSPYFQVHRLS